VPEFIQEMKRRGHSEDAIRKVVYENPLRFFRQSKRWQEWDAPAKVAEASRPDGAPKGKKVKAAK